MKERERETGSIFCPPSESTPSHPTPPPPLHPFSPPLQLVKTSESPGISESAATSESLKQHSAEGVPDEGTAFNTQAAGDGAAGGDEMTGSSVATSGGPQRWSK